MFINLQLLLFLSYLLNFYLNYLLNGRKSIKTVNIKYTWYFIGINSILRVLLELIDTKVNMFKILLLMTSNIVYIIHI